VADNNLTSSEKQFENSKKLAVETAYQTNSSTKLAKEANEKSQNAKANIEKVDARPTQSTFQNKLGQEYPEGMSEEKFSQNDDKGILKTIITRRIVVVDGHGDVYLRTQTTNNTTYSKNDEPITEYVWQRESQNGKLKRN
jgi:hypothetical protein